MNIELNKQETEDAVYSLKKFFASELEIELADLRAKQLLAYFLKEFGPLAYNKGVKDAEDFLRARLEDMSGACFEQPMDYWQSKKKR